MQDQPTALLWKIQGARNNFDLSDLRQGEECLVLPLRTARVLCSLLSCGCRAGWDPSSSCSALCGTPPHIYSSPLDVLCCRDTLTVDMINPNIFPTFAAMPSLAKAVFCHIWESVRIWIPQISLSILESPLWAFWNILLAGLLLLQPPWPI